MAVVSGWALGVVNRSIVTKSFQSLLLLLATGGKQVPVCGAHQALLLITAYLTWFFSSFLKKSLASGSFLQK